MDDAEWDAAVAEVTLSADEIKTLGRCLAVGEHLATWRADGDMLSGTLASDALDQALGLLDELATGRAEALASSVRSLLAVLPPSSD